MRIDRASRVAAAWTLVAAAPVHLIVCGVAYLVQQALREQLASPAPVLPAVSARGDPAPEPATAPAASARAFGPHVRLTGSIHTREGTPVPGEHIELESRALGVRFSVASDARGGFAIPEVPPGTDYEIRVSSEGRYRDFERRGLVVTAETPALDVALEPLASARLAGRMIDADGAPLPRRTLLFQGSDKPGLLLQVTGDERGQFVVDEAPTGRLAFRTRTIPRLEVSGPLLSPAADLAVALVLDEGNHELGGRVLGSHDLPVARAQLNLSWSEQNGVSRSSSTRTAVTDADGYFRFTGLGPGPHRLAARAEGYEETIETYAVSWNSGDIELRLSPIF